MSGDRRQDISHLVSPSGWRLVLAEVRTAVAVTSPAAALSAAAAALAAGGDTVRVDLRRDRVLLSLPKAAASTAPAITAALAEHGLVTSPTGVRAVQGLEIAIDALDIPAVRPFWKAVLDYVDESAEPDAALLDPLGEGPPFWFQQMDVPRPQRNRIHVDVSVPHDVAAVRIEAAQAAGGRLVYVAEAPAFWVLADPEGNEACVATWQGRD
jgi:4a-hydroxytetrahydrobiopterin dehydratase